MPLLAEYIWIDGGQPTANLRSKTKVLSTYSAGDEVPWSELPDWGADGSSTMQADGSNSDIALIPVASAQDPFRPGHLLVLCEVRDGGGNVHSSNTRARLREVLDRGAAASEPLVGFEQEYTFLKPDHTPLGFPDGGYAGPQGPYYCAVGSANIFGREIYEYFIDQVLAAGLKISGFNWEVMPGQAEVQVSGDLLEACDHVWLMRWILHRTAEEFGVVVSLDPKPAKGDWNGAGMHTNFSTKAMREDGGFEIIKKACELIGAKREEHLAVYGDRYQERLTGDHETCSYKEFRYGVADRTASIRIPRHVAETGKGYLEDRRPNANADPYAISARLLRTVLEMD